MRRKGTPCACECDPCKGKNYVRAVNNVSPDPNGDLEIRAGVGIGITQSSDNSITITNQGDPNSFIAGDNIELIHSGNNVEIRVTDDVSVDNLNVAGNIIQQGAAYETHAEKIYTTNDYIYMRDGAVGGLANGSYAGFQVKKYDGTNDGRLVIDNAGTARVGDVGDEQPLLTREETANLNNGALLKWDGVNLKAVDEGTVGTNTKPIKIVNGVATTVTNDLISSVGDGKINGHLDLFRSLVIPDITSSTLIRRYGYKALDSSNNEYWFGEVSTRRYGNRSRILLNITSNVSTDGSRLVLDRYDSGRTLLFMEEYDSNGIFKATNLYDSDIGAIYDVFKTGYVANSGYTLNVSFGVTFPTPPKVFVTANGGSRPEEGLCVTNITTTGFTIEHTSNVVTGFEWIATTL